MFGMLNFDTTDAGTIADSHKVLSGIISTDGSTLITDTLVGANQGLDVFVINDAANPVSVLTNFEYAEDSAHTSGDIGSFALAVRNDVEGSLTDADGDYAPLQVDSLGRLRVIADLDVVNLSEKAEDSAHTSGDIGDYVLSVRQDTLATSTDADGDYQSFKSDSLGKLYVNAPDSDALLTTIDADTSLIAGSIYAEDSAHTSGDLGQLGLAVRNDAGVSLVDTDGDYAPLSVNDTGALYVVDQGGGETANVAIENTDTDVTVAATDLVATDLADRKFAFIYNNGNRTIFVGDSGVTVDNGFPLPQRTFLELRAGANIDLHAIASGGTQDTRILELS